MKALRVSSVFASCAFATALLLGFSQAGCEAEQPASSTFFERTINPVLTNSCTRTNTSAGCHVADSKGNAFGNLDTSDYATLIKRRDLLVDYGPYGQPALLLKNVPAAQLEIQGYDGKKTLITTDIKHAGGSIFDPAATGYQVVRRWLANGATENNTGAPPTSLARAACNTFVPQQAGFDPTKDPAAKDFATFQNGPAKTIKATCSAGNCHGTAANELYFACGDSPEQVRWNYFAASEYLGQTSGDSELLRRPLAPTQGGSFHEGGIIFETQSDPNYQSIKAWADEHGPQIVPAQDAAFDFFAQKVQPVLVKKGCMMLQCHSSAMFHDYRLRGGSGGTFSYSATRKNYELSLQQLSVESADINASRLVRKNLYRSEVRDGGQGVAHRGGALLEDFQVNNASGGLCDKAAPAYDYAAGNLDTIPAYCVIREWHRIEQAKSQLAAMSGIAYVKRTIPKGATRSQDFDVYQPGADLRFVKTTSDATGALILGTEDSLSAKCSLDKTTADIGRPSISWDGKKIAFAARSSATEPFAIYEANIDGTSCAKHAVINAGVATQNGLLIHNFDPAYGPPNENGIAALVFASTRGNLKNDAYDYTGPQRTPADPSKPNANLYSFDPDAAGAATGSIRQLTYLLNMERAPSFMQDGRIVFEAEKRAPNFYQLALRRINLDGGDYHPLFAQRSSIGFHEAGTVVELSDKNLAAIFRDPGVPFAGGQLGFINRSIGLDFDSAKPEDYLLDSSVIDPNAPASPEPSFFLRSLRFPDTSVSGRPGTPTTGVYTAPSSLPNGKVLVSFGAASDPATFAGDYDIYVVDPITGVKTKLLGDAGTSELYAVAAYARLGKGVFKSALDEANGHVTMFPGKPEADITMLNAPILASLLFQNTPTGRKLENFTSMDVLEDMPPPAEVTTIDAAPAGYVATDAFGKVYVRRRPLGTLPINSDGSARMQVPGGLPILYRLPETDLSKAGKWPRTQREAIVFAPGEYAHQSLRKDFFNGLCAGCHGTLSGRPLDGAVAPDVLTQASSVEAKTKGPTNLNLPPGQRGAIEGAKSD